MRLFLLTSLTMIAFAANSLLNRAALSGGHIGASEFASVRVLSGAIMLWLLMTFQARTRPVLPRPDWRGVAGLVAYLVGFSYAYLHVDAGLGALVLFGGVQLTMFAGALAEGESPPAARWLGMGVSLAGLAYLVWPTETVALPPLSIGLMVIASVGWGVYSLAGRRVSDPLAATTTNFIYASPLVVLAGLALHPEPNLSAPGIGLGVASGAITSGLGYALWYRVLPSLGATKGAIAQLSAPVLALIGGALFLSEPLTTRAVLASVLVLGGIALGVVQVTARSKPDR